MLRRLIISAMPLAVLFCFTGRPSEAQGWSFTETVQQSGDCIPYPSSPYNGLLFATKSACETARQEELANNGDDWSVFGDGTCTTIITCTPCTGSDMGMVPGSGTFGGVAEISLTGMMTGDPLFSAHQSVDVENWIGDIIQRLKSLGYDIDETKALSALDFPMTGNPGFDEWYAGQILMFKKPEKGGTVYLKQGQDVIDPNDLKKPVVAEPVRKEEKPAPVVQLPVSKNLWYHPEPLTNGGIPPLPESVYDPNARYEHPRIELVRQAAVTAAGWLPDGAAYPGILAVNIWAENAKAIQDIRDGNNPQDAMTSLTNAATNSLKDLKDQAIGDAGGKILEKGANLISPDKGIAKIAVGASEIFSKNQDLGGEVAYGEGEGIFGKISKAAGWLGASTENPGL